MARQKQPTLEQRLRALERRVAELESIERHRQKVHRKALRVLERVFNESKP